MNHDIERSAAVLTVLNLKGGVGKTMTSFLLASVCEERQLRLLLIDADTQGNLSNSFARERADGPGVEQFLDPSLEADPRMLIRRTVYPHIDILASSSRLAHFDLSNQATWERGDLHTSFVEPLRSLRPLYDLIVFDCPPRLSLVSFAALCASDAVIVPLEAADWGAQGIGQVTDAVAYVRERFNSRLRILGYLVSRFKAVRTYQRSYLAQLRKHFEGLTFDTVIPDLSAYERAVTDNVLLTRHNPSTRAADIARDFCDEVFRRLAFEPGGPGCRPADIRREAAAAA